MERREVSIAGMYEHMGLPRDFQDAEQRMVQWRFPDGDDSIVATIDISDEGEEMLLVFSRSVSRRGVRQGTSLQFLAWYRPGADVIDLIENGNGDIETQLEAFQSGLKPEYLVQIA
jgi:hypothetical protein